MTIQASSLYRCYINKLQLLQSNTEFNFLQNGVKIIPQSRKHKSYFDSKMLCTNSLGPQDSEGNSDVKALFRWSFWRPQCIEIVNIRKLQLMQSSAEFYFLYNGVKTVPQFRKCNEPIRIKDGIHFCHAPGTTPSKISHLLLLLAK